MATPMFRPIIRVDSVTSTMDLLEVLAKDGAPSGTTVIADLQTGGRGRAGRMWVSPPGTALLMSTLLRPPQALSQCGPLALLAGLAVARAVDEHIDARCEIKWPNDVLIEGRKVAGILLSAREGFRAAEQNESPAVIIGIGVNVMTQASDLPQGATSIWQKSHRRVERANVFDGIDAALASVYALFREGTVEPALAELNDRLAFRDQDVIIHDGPRQFRGRLCGVDRDGGLVLEAEGGSVIARSGELTRGPRRVAS